MNLLPQRLRQTAEELVHRATRKVEQLAWRYASRTDEGMWQLSRNRRPDTNEVPDIPIAIWSDWTIQSIKAADNDLMVGQFARAAILCESMQADDRVQSALNGRIKGITKCDLTMVPAETGNKQQCANVAKELEELWSELMPLETIEQIQVWTIFIGFCIGELIWDLKAKLYVPRIKVWHPLHIYYRIDIRRYIVITMEGTIEIEPNDPKWFLFTPFGSYRGWIAGAAVRSIAIPWIVRGFALRDWSRFSEKHGMPIVVAKMAAAKSAEDKARFFSQLQRLGSETTLNLPEGWDALLLEAKDTSWEAFEHLIAQCDRSITLRIRGTNLTTEVGKAGGGGGSNAAAETHRAEDSDYAEADVKKFGQAVKLQVFGPYCLYNHGDARLAPTPLLGAKPQEDKQAKGTTLVAVSQAIVSLEQTGWPIDRQKTAEEFGINLKEGSGDGTLNPTTPDQGGEPTGKRPELPAADDEESLPGAQGEKGDNSPDPTVATRLTRHQKAAWHREKARQHEHLSLAFATTKLFNENHGPDGKFATGSGGGNASHAKLKERHAREIDRLEFARAKSDFHHEKAAHAETEYQKAHADLVEGFKQQAQAMREGAQDLRGLATEARAKAAEAKAANDRQAASDYGWHARRLENNAKALEKLAPQKEQMHEAVVEAVKSGDTRKIERADAKQESFDNTAHSKWVAAEEYVGFRDNSDGFSAYQQPGAKLWESASAKVEESGDQARVAFRLEEHHASKESHGELADRWAKHAERFGRHADRIKRRADEAAKTEGGHQHLISLARTATTGDAQRYIDHVVAESKAAAVPVLRKRVDEVMAEARKAGGFEALKERLARMARDSKRSKLREVVQNALQVSELAGRHAVQVETEQSTKG